MFWIFLTIFSYFGAFVAIFATGERKNAYADRIAIGASFLSLATFFLLFFAPSLQQEFIFASYRISGFTFDLGFLVDKLSLLMGGIVSFVTTLVLFYSRDYMRDDLEKGRFFALLCFFAGSMLGIVYSVSFVQLFIFWELVGLSSYFLIGFWWRDPQVASSARKVFTTIVVGDALLLAGFLMLGSTFGTFTFSEIIREHIHVSLPAAGVFLVLLGALTKSAQLPFSLWLPWAMEGPTPVSALLHSATMVKAGVFLVARILPLVFAAHLQWFVVIVALATIFFASFLALREADIKRILAYSTISQLGFIALGLGLGAYGAALFHMFNDAFYKALLFLCAGVIIHAGGSRDIFSLKPLHWARERVFLLLSVVGALGISGLPPFNGFFSKDLIVEAARETHNAGFFALVLGAAFLSALYIFRWLFLILRNVEGHPSLSNSRELDNGKNVHIGGEKEKKGGFGLSSKIPMLLLALGVILTGWLAWSFFGWMGLSETPHYDMSLGAVSVSLVLLAFGISYLAYFKQTAFFGKLAHAFRPWQRAVDAKFGVTWLYGVCVRFVRALGENLYAIDRYIIDSLLNGAAQASRGIALGARTFDRYVIDGLLHTMAHTTVQICRGSYAFDTKALDGVVQAFYPLLAFFSMLTRRLVSGLATTYVVAFLVAVVFSILFLNGVFAR